MWPFTRKKDKSGPAEFKQQGQPLHINPSPNSRVAIRRHLSRILTCMDAITKEEKRGIVNQTKIASFNTEINRRRMQMEIAGHKVSGTKAGVFEELRRVGGV